MALSEVIRISDLAAIIGEALDAYESEVETALQRAVDQTAAKTDAEIRRHITFHERTGEYVRAFQFKRGKAKGKYSKTWHVAAPYYRLTHLLEDGHASRDGTRTRAFPHIQYGAELARKNLPEFFEKELRR